MEGIHIEMVLETELDMELDMVLETQHKLWIIFKINLTELVDLLEVFKN